MKKKLVCPISGCDYEPRAYKNDDPKTAITRLIGHLTLKHHKGELVEALINCMGFFFKNGIPLEDIEQKERL